jgi:dolichol-phosphate mannosyltransferase
MARGSDVLVAIATYNEIENLPQLVEEIFRYARDVDILVVDDNSPDGTGRWCDHASAQDQRIGCLHRPSKLGLGTAMVRAIEHAIDCGYPFLVTMDADFSHHPRYLPDLVGRMNPSGQPPNDVVIGSRYVPGGAVTGWPRHRRWMSRGINAYARCLLGLAPRDCSGSYRCYRTAKLKELDIRGFQSSGYAFCEEVLWHLERRGARIEELPIVFANRQRGKTKIDSAEALRALGTILMLRINAARGR